MLRFKFGVLCLLWAVVALSHVKQGEGMATTGDKTDANEVNSKEEDTMDSAEDDEMKAKSEDSEPEAEKEPAPEEEGTSKSEEKPEPEGEPEPEPETLPDGPSRKPGVVPLTDPPKNSAETESPKPNQPQGQEHKVVYIEVPEILEATESDLVDIKSVAGMWRYHRDVPADQLRDFEGLCYSWTRNKLFEVGDAWSIAPYCGISKCIQNDGQLFERIYDCGPQAPDIDPSCRVTVRSDPQAVFPLCCPLKECTIG
ncbi:unnamed protein product [Cyprideis torosa]|uniref:Uncharacterized protein n=1 Tax=Cyprideis torosa TaxID=163714 RepID=A0A7R8ZJ29_9CRUS|nr:unnamed protein product [Cyprideis torosa]CAG0881379.1 unnamed protein product [Cyprideis torosa]